MKKRRVALDERGLIIGTQVDVTDSLHHAQMMRDAKTAPMADSVCVGTMDAAMFYALAAKAGVRPDDHEALEDFATRLFQGGSIGGIDGADYQKFRVYEGKV